MTKVMIVEDAAFMRIQLKQMLERNGFEIVSEAENGSVAVQKYPNIHPDLVTMDIVMPIMDGIKALREIKKYDENAKVIMCSSVEQNAIVIEAIKAGARDFVTKPLEEQRLVSAIQKVCYEQ